MSQPKTVDRGVSFIKFVLGLLRAHPDGMRPRDIYAEIESKLPLDDFDKETMKGSGLPRWRAALHFHSVAATKAVLLVKSDGRWRVTDEGQKFVTLPDYELKRLMRSRDETAPLDTSVLFEDAKEKAREEIDTYLDTLSGYEFQNLVAALLEGMGYATSTVSKPGSDGGTDILAYIDPLGAQTPHIRVQVKHRDQTASREDVAALRGIIRGDREIGLFVSSGGFSREARREAGHGAVHIELVDLDRFLELWLQHYSKIPEVKRSKLRLEPIHFLAVVSLT
ncbi:restriction system protein [Bradyrhizobium sp. AZCC 1678]|uniref:restriction endonuclease n=1 Tax=Bradyrhizobium sp. AZCC 1678 TaxID=3117030 RepID=UPI002FF13ABE